MDNQGIQSDIPVGTAFESASESQKWAIRYGAEPIDLHLMNDRGIKQNPEEWGFSAGPGALFNHNYIEIGRVNADGEFETLKRIHGLGLEEKNGEWQMTGEGRLIGFVIDGKYNEFTEDLIQRDDPHHEKTNQLQHADVENLTGGDYTKTVFEGSEREVLQIYGAMVHATIEINNQDLEFNLLGTPNSNTFNAEMKEKVSQAADHLNISDRLGEHDAWGWDIGSDADSIETEAAHIVATWHSIDDLRDYIDQLEQISAKQWLEIKNEGLEIDLETELPTPTDITGP